MSIEELNRRSGILVEHQDGRRGIAFDDDQLKEFEKQEKYIVRFFTDNDITAGIELQKRAVKYDKLTTKGYITKED